MKKITSLVLIVTLLLSAICILSSCGKNVEKYELVDIDFSTVSVDHYEYNYIEFNFDKGTYKLENKAKTTSIVSTQTGRFLVDNQKNVTITNDSIPSQNYVLYSGEKAYFKGNKLHVEAYIQGFGKVYMIFEK